MPDRWQHTVRRGLGDLTLVGCLFVCLLCFDVLWLESAGRVYPNVTVDRVPVGGLDQSRVELTLVKWVLDLGAGPTGSLGTRTVELTDSLTGGTWSVPAASFGLAVDIGRTAAEATRSGRERPATVFGALEGLVRCSVRGAAVAPVVIMDRDRATSTFEEIARSVNVLPTNASLDPRTGDVRQGHSGRLLDPAATAEAIVVTVADQLREEAWEVPIAFAVAPPRGDVARLMALERDPLATFTTLFDTSELGRSWNIALASARLDGTVIEPGAVVSFNGLVGAREPEAGFCEAREIVNNELRPGFGGGVCQVATTVFNAALLADLDVPVRHQHSRPTTYVGLGRDATVAYPHLDLVVGNPRAFPVILTVQASGGTVKASFWGRRTFGTTVSLATEESGLRPATCAVEVREDLPPGVRQIVEPPFDGREVRLWREVRQLGRPIRREVLAVDHYEPIDGLVRIGPAQPVVGGRRGAPARWDTP